MASDTGKFAEESLPTLPKLGNPEIPETLDVAVITAKWLSAFEESTKKSDIDGVVNLFVTSSFVSTFLKEAENSIPTAAPSTDVSVYWKDALALTWDFRTLEGTAKIRNMLEARLETVGITNVQLREDLPPSLVRPFPDIAWIQLLFTFETKIGKCSAIVRLVPVTIPNSSSADIQWLGHSIFTNLDDLIAFPEAKGLLRNHEPNHGKWEEQRRQEVAFENEDPKVLIIGAGQSGLGVAARLKALGVSTLMIEKNKRVGDNWRTRYEALCLHDPVWYDHMPYIPFPATWPVFTPAKKLANWLEHYAEAMELNVWTSSTVLSAVQNMKTKLWSVKVQKSDGSERIFKVKHIVIATGFKGGMGYMPSYPGMEDFKGKILHSTEHDKASNHIDKKVVVVGACTSAHDICVDFADHGIDVTMFQRSSTHVLSAKKGMPILLAAYSELGPSTEVADFLSQSMPMLLFPGFAHRLTKIVAEADKETLDGLNKRGFRTNNGYKDCGLVLMVYQKAGGYYIDVGGSEYIISGSIKLKSDSQISSFSPSGLVFSDGSTLPADVVIFCTGLDDPKNSSTSTIRAVFGDEVARICEPIWGLNEEGDVNGCFKEIATGNGVEGQGYEGLYCMMGNLALCRFYSKHVALQIKAREEGIFDGKRHSLLATRAKKV